MKIKEALIAVMALLASSLAAESSEDATNASLQKEVDDLKTERDKAVADLQEQLKDEALDPDQLDQLNELLDSAHAARPDGEVPVPEIEAPVIAPTPAPAAPAVAGDEPPAAAGDQTSGQ